MDNVLARIVLHSLFEEIESKIQKTMITIDFRKNFTVSPQIDRGNDALAKRENVCDFSLSLPKNVVVVILSLSFSLIKY